MKYSIIIFMAILIIGCQNQSKENLSKNNIAIDTVKSKKINQLTIFKNNSDNAICLNQVSRSDKVLRELALNKGDTIAYYDLFISYLDRRIQDFLPYALIMANKYQYHLAYYHVYLCLLLISDDWDEEAGNYTLDKLDTTTCDMAIDYLKKGVVKGDKQCMHRLGDYYIKGKYVKKDVKYGEYLKEKGRMGSTSN